MTTTKLPIDISDFRIIKSGNIVVPSLTVSGSAGSWSIGEAITTTPHGLGYTPAIIAFLQEVGGAVTDNFILPSNSFIGPNTGSIGGFITYQAAVDATSIYVTVDCMIFGTGTTINNTGATIQYYLMGERIKRTN